MIIAKQVTIQNDKVMMEHPYTLLWKQKVISISDFSRDLCIVDLLVNSYMQIMS